VYAIRVSDRDTFIASLAEKGIFCGIHYPIPVHLQKAYSALQLGPEDRAVSEMVAKKFVSLPIYPELHEDQIQYVARGVKDTLKATTPVE
jgi:dTDP-4-amino-4,6-dideoxygalactose transaminase